MKDLKGKSPERGKFTRAAVLALALSGMTSLDAANNMLAQTNPQDAPITEEEFQSARSEVPVSKKPRLNNEVLQQYVNTQGKKTKKGKPSAKSSLTVDTKLSYTITSTDIRDDGAIEAILENSASGVKFKMIDKEGDLIFDILTTLDGKPLKTKPEDLIITNLDEVLDSFRIQEPPVCIYGGPNMMDLYEPAEPEDPSIILEE